MKLQNMLQNVKVSEGFSWNLQTDSTPVAGYAVSAFKGLETVIDHVPSKEEIAEFVIDNGAILFSEGYLLGATEKVVGLWEDNGKYYLDVSLVYHNLKMAIGVGKLNEQIAIFDIANCTSIYLSQYVFGEN